MKLVFLHHEYSILSLNPKPLHLKGLVSAGIILVIVLGMGLV
jgi:hypothetical protein